VGLAGRCEAAARRRFPLRYDFWDAVMVADARLATDLLEGRLADSEHELVRAYREAIEQVPRSARELDSVLGQLRLLGRFLRLRGDAEPAAEALGDIAAALDPAGGPAVREEAVEAPAGMSPEAIGAARSGKAEKSGKAGKVGKGPKKGGGSTQGEDTPA
jgi:hypothetical protein